MHECKRRINIYDTPGHGLPSIIGFGGICIPDFDSEIACFKCVSSNRIRLAPKPMITAPADQDSEAATSFPFFIPRAEIVKISFNIVLSGLVAQKSKKKNNCRNVFEGFPASEAGTRQHEFHPSKMALWRREDNERNPLPAGWLTFWSPSPLICTAEGGLREEDKILAQLLNVIPRKTKLLRNLLPASFRTLCGFNYAPSTLWDRGQWPDPVGSVELSGASSM